jgi:signal transduction histidine kinase
MDEPPATLLQDALRGAAEAQTPRSTARAIVGACVGRLKARRGGFYRLDLSIGAYIPFVRPEQSPEIHVPVAALGIPSQRIGALGHFLAAAEDSDGVVRDPVEGIAVYAFRGESCVGVLRLDGPALGDIGEAMRADLLALANLLGLVYENEFAYNLLSELQRPLDFDKPDREFFALIADLIKASSRMEFVALREHVDGQLRCIALAGFGEKPNLREWDYEEIDLYEDFAIALSKKKTVAVKALDPKRHAALTAQPWSKNVRSFVAIPVKVGNEVFGVLSVAARCEYDYSQVELRGFESIANAVGVSITNFRSSRRLGVRIGEYADMAMTITALEVARSVKHEALNYITIASTGLREIWVRLGKPKDDVDLLHIDNALSRLGDALNEITKTSTASVAGEWRQTSLKEIWEEARAAVAGRLQEQRIDVRVGSGDATVYARPEWLRQVFLNLLLNSIDAFRDSKKSGRRIDIAIDPQSERSREIQVTYRDNATGINPHRLRVPGGAESLPVEQSIFQEGVSSKRDGSGFGLWLVRHILADHYASIDLADYRGGVTFVMRLPKPKDAEAMIRSSS